MLRNNMVRLRIPMEFDARYEADTYAEEYLGPPDESEMWCTEAQLQFQEADLEIEVYEKAIVVLCLAGCNTDCRTDRYKNGEPLR